MRKILFVDLDRTLLDTACFLDRLWTVIADIYQLNKEYEMAQVPHWYRAMGDYRYYDLKLHLEQGLGKDPGQVVERIMPILKKEDFLFPDASELKAWQKTDYEIRVLTFGPRWVQEFKLRLTPALADLPCDIILGAKGDFIAKHFAHSVGFLVDDKRNPVLPKGITEVWLNRDMTTPNKQNGIISINSLTQVRELL